MTTLLLDIRIPSRIKPPYTLTRYFQKSSCADDVSPVTLMVTDATRLSRKASIRAFRAKMRDNHDEVHDVVLKVATISSGHLLLNEAHFYEDELLGLQGDAVPRCFGFFQGDLGLIKISCLILEDCGSVMEGSLYDVDIATKLKLVEKLDKIHTAGVIHQDLAARHIVMKDNEPYWIDFGEAARHSCRKRMEVTPGDFSPDLHEFGCTEIYEFVERLDLWKSIYVHYQNNVFFLDLVESPEYLYHSLHPAQIETEEQQDQAWREAEETYRFIAEDRKLWIARYGQTQGCQ